MLGIQAGINLHGSIGASEYPFFVPPYLPYLLGNSRAIDLWRAIGLWRSTKSLINLHRRRLSLSDLTLPSLPRQHGYSRDEGKRSTRNWKPTNGEVRSERNSSCTTDRELAWWSICAFTGITRPSCPCSLMQTHRSRRTGAFSEFQLLAEFSYPLLHDNDRAEAKNKKQ